MKAKSSLQKAYIQYRKKKTTKSSLLRTFLSVVPEIVLRSTKLEGEPVTRKMVYSLFK